MEARETRTRSVWIAIAAVLVVGCCCLAVAAAAAGGWFFLMPAVSRSVPVEVLEMPSGVEQERVERAFEVGEVPSLVVDNFAGSVIVREGEPGVIEVVAIKHGAFGADPRGTKVEITNQNGEVVVRTRNPRRLNNAAVELEITAPRGTRLDLTTGAGSLEVSGAEGLVRMNTGAGSIEYEGAPEGDCRFETGAGGIELKLPRDLNMEVDLQTGIGAIEVEYDVTGRTSAWAVQGVIGDGSQGSIDAFSGAGSIELKRR